MLQTNQPTFSSPTTPFGPMDPPGSLPMQAREQEQPSGHGMLSNMFYATREIVCVCVDAIIGRYDL